MGKITTQKNRQDRPEVLFSWLKTAELERVKAAGGSVVGIGWQGKVAGGVAMGDPSD